MNNFTAIGRISKDLIVGKTANGMSVCRFSIAINRKFAKEGQPTADFFNIVTFSKTAEFCDKYFRKGMQIGLVGSVQNNNWEKDGTKHYDTAIFADSVYFAEGKKSEENQSEPAKVFVKPVEQNEGFYPIGDDELPF